MKIFKRCLLISLLFILITTFSVITKASSTTYVTKEEYFTYLTENFGHNFENNIHGNSCSIVALEMMLLYYDTFLNDNIVPEHYEVKSNTKYNSPGSINDQYLYYPESNFQEHMEEYKDKSLFAKLVSLNNYETQVDYNTRITLLNLYFNEIGFIEGTHYSISSVRKANGHNVKQFIINNINNGNIVLTNIYRVIDKDYIVDHNLIAYEYTNNTIYMNYGYHSGIVNTSHEDMSIIDSDGNEIIYHDYSNAMTINFNLPHVHSDNYYSYANVNEHINRCPCGYSVYENHKFIVDNDFTGTCANCKNTQSISNSATIVSDPDYVTNCGTYVTLYGGLYRGNDILPGFTRLLYFDYYSPSQSRLAYNWYSTNESVATVTPYGTVVGVSPGTCEIYAYLKTDPTRLGVITINTLDINLDQNYQIQITTDNKTNFYENGTEVTELNQSPNLFTIHSGYSRVICFSEQNMYPDINDFVWYASNDSVYITDFGTIIANEVEEETSVIIYGHHKRNINVIVNQEFIIIPN